MKLKTTGKYYIEKRVGKKVIEKGYAAREIKMMTQCWGHPNIVRIKSFDLDYHQYGYGSIFMQRCELGSLDGLIHQFSRRNEQLADEGLMWKVFWDMSLALAHLITGTDPKASRIRACQGKTIHTVKGANKLAHMDLKPGNIFLTREDWLGADKTHFPTCVLGDFGCGKSEAEIVAGRSSLTEMSGHTEDFRPPEYPSWHENGDIYMLGLTIHCLGRMRNRPDIKNYPSLHPWYKDETLRYLVRKCLSVNPVHRPTANDLPAMVWAGYLAWRKGRRDDGALLPEWALQQ